MYVYIHARWQKIFSGGGGGGANQKRPTPPHKDKKLTPIRRKWPHRKKKLQKTPHREKKPPTRENVAKKAPAYSVNIFFRGVGWGGGGSSAYACLPLCAPIVYLICYLGTL